MEIKLKAKSLHANFYRKSHGLYPADELPKSICNYSWALLWATLWLPLTWWSYMWQAIPFLKIKDGGYYLWQRILTGILSYFSGILACVVVYKCINNVPKFLEYLKMMGITIAAILIIIIIVAICITIRDAWKENIKTKEGYKIASGTFYSWKNKICPKITWKSKTTEQE